MQDAYHPLIYQVVDPTNHLFSGYPFKAFPSAPNSMINGVTLHSFTYADSSGQRHTLDLRRGPTYTSRESCGVWVFEYQAWKIFSTTNQYNRLKADYERASTGGVPIPGYSIILGRATCSQGRNREGFALVSTCGSGRPFDLKFGTGPFKQIIDSINSVDILVRCAVDLITL